MTRRTALCCLLAAAVQPALATAEAIEDDVLSDAIDRATGTDPRTLTELLHWSLKHTDLDELHAKAEAIRAEGQPGVLSAAGNAGEAPAVGQASLPSPDADADAAASQEWNRPVTPMSKERRVELDEMMRVMMPSMVDEMKKLIEIAEDETADVEWRLEVLEALQEHVEDIDNARDFNTIGGFTIVLRALVDDSEPRLQTAAAWIAGTAVQNNRELQLALVGHGVVPRLLKLLEAHASADVRAKALFAISGMLRGCPEAQAAFTEHDGFATLLGALADSSPRLVRKALVLLTDLLAEGRAPRDDLEPPPSATDADGAAVPVRPAAPNSAAWNDVVPRGVDAAAVLRGALSNSTRLCDAVLRCLRLPDIDTRDKAVRALEQILESGLVHSSSGGADGGSGGACGGETSAGLRDALRTFGDECAAAGTCGGDDTDDLLELVRSLEERVVA